MKPYEWVGKKLIGMRNNYYLKRVDKLEGKAIQEFKNKCIDSLRLGRKVFLTDKDVFAEDNYILSTLTFFKDTSSFHYGKKGRKYACLYGELNRDRIAEKKDKYLNDIVIWLLDRGCDVRYEKIWYICGNQRKGVLVATYTTREGE